MQGERRLLSSTDDLTVGVLRVSADLEVLYANGAARGLLGPVSGGAWGLADFGPLGPRLAGLARRAQASRSPVVDREAESAAGLLDVTVNPEPEHDGRCGLLVEVVSLGWHARAWAERQAASLQAALQQMLRGLSHELKNPLGGLRGAAQLLERRAGEAEVQEFCRVIVREADRLAVLVDRYASDAGELPLRVANVHEPLERVYQLVAGEERVRLERDYDPSIPELEINVDALIQALLNLVNNAVEAGARSVVLRSRVRRRGPESGREPAPSVALDIEDDGPGVPESLGVSILYPMVTGRAGGTGLGLTVVQAIAARHHGRLEFASRPGSTCFTLYLPLERGHG